MKAERALKHDACKADSRYNGHGDSTTTKETLFSRADEALYSVKEGGRNNYCIYEE